MLGAVAVGYRMDSKRKAAADGASPPLRATQAHEGTTREGLQVHYGRVPEDSDLESKTPQPLANSKSADGLPSRQSQDV